MPQLFRSLWASYRLTNQPLSLCIRIGRGQKLKITRTKSAKVFIDGVLSVDSWGEQSALSSITLKNNSILKISGDFLIGPSVHISVNSHASLFFGGRGISTGSGITANSRIMVENFVSIGKDCIIAWDTFITDSNWHEISGQQRSVPTQIGDNVWISHGASVLKGSNIPSGCIVAAKAVVTHGNFQKNCLIGGLPARVLKADVVWSR